jgi:8-oxo-dGTP pyrophosphatase MutT (NUDIX family)
MWPEELDSVREADRFIRSAEPDEALFSRKNFAGHITGSGFVLSRSARVLLIHHWALDRFLQPGGHVDEGETPLEAAQREIAEETGITQLSHVPFFDDALVPMDIDSHPIPAKPKRGEPAHVHHDFRYLFRYTGDEDAVLIAPYEARAYRWATLEDLNQMDGFERVARKLKR